MIRNDLSEITKRMFGKTFNNDINAQAAAIDRAILGSKDVYKIGGIGFEHTKLFPMSNYNVASEMIERAACAPYTMVTNAVTLTLNSNESVMFGFWNPYTGDFKPIQEQTEVKVSTMVWADGRGEMMVDTDHYAIIVTNPSAHGPNTIQMSEWNNSIIIPDYENAGILASTDDYNAQIGEESIYLLVAIDITGGSDSRTDYSTKGTVVNRDLRNLSFTNLAQYARPNSKTLEPGNDNTISFKDFALFSVFREGAPDWFIHFKCKPLIGMLALVTELID